MYFNYFADKSAFIRYITGNFTGSSISIPYAGSIEQQEELNSEDHSIWLKKPAFSLKVKLFTSKNDITFQFKLLNETLVRTFKWDDPIYFFKEDLCNIITASDHFELQAMDHNKFYLHYKQILGSREYIIFSGTVARPKWHWLSFWQ